MPRSKIARCPATQLSAASCCTGFLGSGKTLLLIANTAVIVNEFGEIGLDQALMQSSTDNVVLLEAGCLCCTIADSLHETLPTCISAACAAKCRPSSGW